MPSLQPKMLLIFPHGLHGASFITILKIALEHLLECQWQFSCWGLWNKLTFCRQNRSKRKATPVLPQINQNHTCQCFQFCFSSPENSAGSAAATLSLLPSCPWLRWFFFLHSLDPDTSKLLVCTPKASAIFHIHKNHHVPMFSRLRPLELSEEGGSGRRIIFKSTSVG